MADDPLPQDDSATSPNPPNDRGGLSARAVALRVLSDLRDRRRTARHLIDELLDRQRMGAREGALATELVMGVVRHRLTLARLFDGLAVNGWKRINHRLQQILLLGGYQLIWLDGVPPFAAVNESVNQAKSEGGGKAGRFVNAILRQLLREMDERRMPASDADPARSVRVSPATVCSFHRPLLPDPKERPVEHLATATSHPLWLVSRWVETFGLDEAERICQAGMFAPPIWCRPNRLRATADQLWQRLKDEGFQADCTPDIQAVVVPAGTPVTRTAPFQDGWFQPQDRTAMEVVERLGLEPGQCVVDLCAGLGTKTTQLAEVMRNQGLVLASDKDETKLEAVRDNCRRLGVEIVETVPADALLTAVRSAGRVDWILVDVPCSNTGVLARRPEARYRVNRRTLAGLASVQRELLEQAAALAGAGTDLVNDEVHTLRGKWRSRRGRCSRADQ